MCQIVFWVLENQGEHNNPHIHLSQRKERNQNTSEREMLRREDTRDQGFKSDGSCHVVKGVRKGAHEKGLQQHETPEGGFSGSSLPCQENVAESTRQLGRWRALSGLVALLWVHSRGCTDEKPSGSYSEQARGWLEARGCGFPQSMWSWTPWNGLLATQRWHPSCPQLLREAIILKRRTGVPG